MNVIQFADDNVKLNEKGKPWSWSKYQRDVLTLAYQRNYSIRLWSEVKKSGKTFLAAIIAIWEAVTNPDTEIVCCANDEEQALSRVFQTVCQLIKYNPELTASAKVLSNEIRFTNGSIIKAVSSDYKGQAGGRQRLTIFDELWCFDLERMTRLFEEMTPPPTEQGAYLLIVSYAGFSGEGELLQSLYQRGLKGQRIHKSFECYRAKVSSCFGLTSAANRGSAGLRGGNTTRSKHAYFGQILSSACTTTIGLAAKAFLFYRSNGTRALMRGEARFYPALPFSLALTWVSSPTMPPSLASAGTAWRKRFF